MFRCKNSFYFILILSLSLVYNSCKKSDDTVEPEINNRGDYLSVTELKEFSIAELSALAATRNITIPILYSIKAYKTIYLTIDNDGNYKKASGLILIPQKSGSYSLVSAQHGTQFTKSGGAVSDLGESFIEAMMPAVFGYITFMPDYLGFGASSDMFHPYHHAKLTANTCIDMIRAGKKYLKNQNIQTTDKFFLMGYSEGGYATMATLKEIQENYSSEFKITAAAPGAGAFNISGTASYMINADQIDYPGYIPYVLMTYIKYYKLNINLTDIFQEPYASRIPGLLDGSKDSPEITANLTINPKQLLTSKFIQDFNGSGYQELKSYIKQNDNYNWKPNVPIHLFQGLKDRQVPYFNSQDALTAMKALGANVTFVPCLIGSQDHVESALYWFIDTMAWFAMQ
jgi:hypothetical protein